MDPQQLDIDASKGSSLASVSFGNQLELAVAKSVQLVERMRGVVSFMMANSEMQLKAKKR